MKKSPIFAKLLLLVPLGRLSSELFEFLRYLYPFQRYANFCFLGFFYQCMLIYSSIFTKITVFIELFMLNPDLLEFLRYLLPFKSYKWKHLNFFNSAWPQCEAFLAYFPLLHVQNVEEWVLMKINQFCFLHQKAEMHSFAAKLILDISEEYWQCSSPDKWNVGSQTHRPQRVKRFLKNIPFLPGHPRPKNMLQKHQITIINTNQCCPIFCPDLGYKN